METSFKILEEKINELILMHNNADDEDETRKLCDELFLVARQLRTNAEKLNDLYIEDNQFVKIGVSFETEMNYKSSELIALAVECERQADRTEILIEEITEEQKNISDHEKYYSSSWRYL